MSAKHYAALKKNPEAYAAYLAYNREYFRSRRARDEEFRGRLVRNTTASQQRRLAVDPLYKQVSLRYKQSLNVAAVQRLDTSYVQGQLCAGTSLVSDDIPCALVEAKRAEIKLTRLLRSMRAKGVATGTGTEAT